MEMVERVARAIFASGLPASWAEDPAVVEETWNAAKRDRETAYTQARAAIAAMREPTAEMLAARYSHGGDNYDVAEGAYRSMIAAALPAQSMAEIS